MVTDGVKILGPVIIGENTLVAAGALITKDIPANSIAYGINKYKEKDENYELVYYNEMPTATEQVEANKKLLERFKNFK